MQAIEYERYGEPAEVLRLRLRPDLAPPPTGKVLIQVIARTIHPGDLLAVRGTSEMEGVLLPEAGRPGLEGVGIVLAVGAGEGVEAPAVGSRVAFFPGPGAWSEQVVVDADATIVVPEGLDDGVASQMLVNGITALRLLRAAGGSTPKGKWLLTAAASAVARLLTLLAQAQGQAVISLVRDGATVERLRQWLPQAEIIASDQPGWRAAVERANGGKLSVVLDAVGGPLVADLLALLDEGGSLFVYGALSGAPAALHAMDLVIAERAITGVSIGRWWATTDPAQRRLDMKSAVALAVKHPEQFPITARFSLDRLSEALAAAETGGRTGSILLTSPVPGS